MAGSQGGSAVRKSRPLFWSDRRPHPISPAGSSHGVTRSDRSAGERANHAGELEQPVWSARTRNRRIGTRTISGVSRSIRTLGPSRMDNGVVVSSPAATIDTDATQLLLAFDDNRLASTLFGQYGQNL